MRLRLFTILLVVPLLTLALATPAYALASRDVEAELMCQCGCTMVVDVCDCDTANQMRAKIQEMIDQGQSKEQIVAYWVGQYGEKVLSSPTKKGFNLVAWVVPFVAVLAAGGLLYFVLKTWARKGRSEQPQVAESQVSVEEADEYRDRLEGELKRYREGDTK